MKKRLKRKILVLGVTGGLGTGKTTVTGMFSRLGASCLNADKIYHRLIKPQRPLYKKIVSAFGKEILGRHQQINRERLAKLAFSKKQTLRKLCRLTHPVIIKRINLELSRLKRLKRYKVIVLDAPLLVEAGSLDMVDKLIVVKMNKKNQIRSCQKQLGLSYAEAGKRINSQMPLQEKIKLADYVINNNGTLEQTRKQVKDIWTTIQKSSHCDPERSEGEAISS